ncbi:MAG: DUF1648 domain-containing protein [Clostridiaceae bacterium]|nr:DUF1648 domain-containing protein [Clostridiaceae bacterium]
MFLFTFLLNLFTVYIPLLLIGFFMPNFTKKTLLFGIVIPEEVSKNEEVIKLEKIYKRNYGLSAVLVSVVINIISIKTQNVHLLSWGIMILILIMTANYVYVHNKAKLLKKEKGWTIDKKQVVVVNTSHHHKQSYLSPHWFWIPISIMLFTFVFTMIQYPHLPEEIPIRFDYSGEAIGYSTKSFFSGFGLPLTQLGITILFYFIYRMIKGVKPSIQASRPKVSLQQNQIAKYYWAIYLLGTLVVLQLHFSYIQLNVLQVINPAAPVNLLIHAFAIAIPMLGAILVAVKTGQSGSRIKVELSEEADTNVIDREDDRFWKWGMFYYNPEDPSLMIEKRFGIGWTINCGRPIGMAITIIILVVLVGGLVLPRVLGGN